MNQTFFLLAEVVKNFQNRNMENFSNRLFCYLLATKCLTQPRAIINQHRMNRLVPVTLTQKNKSVLFDESVQQTNWIAGNW